MAKLEHLDTVAVWVRDQAKAEEFYTRVLGLELLDRMPEVGWLRVVPAAGGTAVALLVPDPGQPEYERLKAQVGGQTGIGFEVGDLRATVAQLQARGATVGDVGLDPDAPGGIHATVEDQDGSVLMLFQPTPEAKGKAGVGRIGFVNVVVRDLASAKAFCQASLGLAAGHEEAELAWAEVRCGDRGAAVGLLQPVEEVYQDPEAFASDMAHLGEPTGITFLTADLDALAAELRARGVVFTRAPETQPWGGRMAEFADPDGNTFQALEHAASLRRWAPVRTARAAAKPRRRAATKPAPRAKAKPGRAKPKAAKAPAKAGGAKRRGATRPRRGKKR